MEHPEHVSRCRRGVLGDLGYLGRRCHASAIRLQTRSTRGSPLRACPPTDRAGLQGGALGSGVPGGSWPSRFSRNRSLGRDRQQPVDKGTSAGHRGDRRRGGGLPVSTGFGVDLDPSRRRDLARWRGSPRLRFLPNPGTRGGSPISGWQGRSRRRPGLRGAQAPGRRGRRPCDPAVFSGEEGLSRAGTEIHAGGVGVPHSPGSPPSPGLIPDVRRRPNDS